MNDPSPDDRSGDVSFDSVDALADSMRPEAIARANIKRWQQEELRARQRALELAGDVSPYFNLAPLLELVRQAHAMGFEVVKP